MPKTEIVPFGKYKGQPIDVLAQDKEYCDWLVAQDWFRAKFVGIHTLIVNHFGEATETPEHNALQARFLDPAWCQRLCLSLGLADAWQKYRSGYLDDYGKFMAQPYDGSTDLRRADKERSDLGDFAERFAALKWEFSIFDRRFETDGIDVQFSGRVQGDQQLPYFWDEEIAMYGSPKYYRWHRGSGITRPKVDRSHRVECKPIVQDDYPGILRQMQASGAGVLVAGDVRSKAVSYDQIRAIFGSSGIYVRTVDEIEKQYPIWPDATQ